MAQYTLERSAPLAVRIHRIGVNAPVMGLTTDPSGVLQVPPVADSNLAGWYQDGPTPGERGNAIVLGHVDTTSGPAVFYGLSTLKPGDTVDIDRADGYTATFRVDDVELFSKKDFPDDRVYGDADGAQLRLITCGGTYDHKHHDYTGNVVVFAHLASVRRT